MSPSLEEILNQLERMAPSRLAEQWDNPGLQVGDRSQEIRKVFLALDPSMRALDSALKCKADLLLTHHPLIFKPLSIIEAGAYPGDVIFEAVRSGIAVAAAHTNLDAAEGGISDILADLLGLKGVEVLQEIPGETGVGLGRIGDLKEERALSLLAEDIQNILGCEHLKMAGPRDAMVRRVAVVGGSGGSLAKSASLKGADLLLTGDVGHHHALEAESLGLVLIDGGHFHTEKAAFKVFAERLRAIAQDRQWDLVIEEDDQETDPMGYDWDR